MAAVHAVVVPWPRADTAAAAAYVKAHRRPEDVVAGNDWTHQYYFRRLGPAFRVEALPDLLADRCWIVYTAEFSAEERGQGAFGMGPAGWRLVERRDDFAFTTVLLLERPDAK